MNFISGYLPSKDIFPKGPGSLLITPGRAVYLKDAI
jgi:hypothetical protein